MNKIADFAMACGWLDDPELQRFQEQRSQTWGLIIKHSSLGDKGATCTSMTFEGQNILLMAL